MHRVRHNVVVPDSMHNDKLSTRHLNPSAENFRHFPQKENSTSNVR